MDIGTRTIIGVIMEETESRRIVKLVMKEHEERAMLDGQIHDIVSVANLIKM